MLSVIRLVILLFGLLTTVNGSDGSNYITNPASNTGINPVWTLGDQQVVAWKTTLGVFNVTFWQQSLVQESAASQGNIYAKIHDTDHVTNFTWTVQLYGFDLDYSNVFFIWINPDGPDGFTSAYFNITKPKETTTTASISSATASSSSNFTADPVSSGSRATKTASSSSSPSAAETDESDQSSDLTTTSKIALGVGAGVGAPVLAALGVLIWLKARQTKASEKAAAAAAAGTAAPYGPDIQQRRPQSSMKEMYGTNPADFIPELQHSGNPKHFYPELPAQRF